MVVWSPRNWLVTALSVLVLLGALLAVPASSLTQDDIRLRDSLIVDQESLLDVYRCQFDIDTEEVAGGCVDGVPASPTENPPLFNGVPAAEGIAKRDALIAEQEALLNAYRCRFDIDTEVVPGGCEMETDVGDPPVEADVGDSPVEVDWQPFEGYGRHQPNLGMFWQEGAYTQAVSWEGAPDGVVPELRVACFDSGSSQGPLLKVYVAWNWFITSRIDTYQLDVQLPGDETRAFDSINSTGSEASFLRYADDIAEFTQLLVNHDGEEITVSSFVPTGGSTIAATFDLTGSSAAIEPILQACPLGSG